ncbi:MAG: NAD-dependent epimerase/dehydratase family protein [Pseudomonadales bacterium]
MLLTGAGGFIGRHLQRVLLDRGYQLRVLLRPGSRNHANIDPRCEICRGELTDLDALAQALDGVTAAVYAAGAVRGRSGGDFRQANVAGVESLVAAMGAASVPPQLVLLSSLAAERPELSDYACSKRAGEDVLRGSAGISWSILRPPAVYGPGDVELRPLLKLVRAGLLVCPGPADQRLALLHVHDLARAVAACLEHPAACRHGCFALDDGKPGGYDWSEVADAVAGRQVPRITVPRWLLDTLARGNLLLSGVLGYAPMLTPGKVRELQQASWLCDNRPLTLATGWQPQIGLAQGAATL